MSDHEVILRRRADPLVGSPLTLHDVAEATRNLDLAVLEAQEAAGETRPEALKSPEQAANHVFALESLINRQAELIAALREQLRKAVS